MTSQGVDCDRSHTSKMTGQGAVYSATDWSFYLYVTGHDRSHRRLLLQNV